MLTIKQVQAELSPRKCDRQIRTIETNGYAHLGPVLRVALYSNPHTNWEQIRTEFHRQNPETNPTQP
jgi:hypothetical protein